MLLRANSRKFWVAPRIWYYGESSLCIIYRMHSGGSSLVVGRVPTPSSRIGNKNMASEL